MAQKKGSPTRDPTGTPFQEHPFGRRPRRHRLPLGRTPGRRAAAAAGPAPKQRRAAAPGGAARWRLGWAQNRVIFMVISVGFKHPFPFKMDFIELISLLRVIYNDLNGEMGTS